MNWPNPPRSVQYGFREARLRARGPRLDGTLKLPLNNKLAKFQVGISI
jgi:hypothetical protein